MSAILLLLTLSSCYSQACTDNIPTVAQETTKYAVNITQQPTDGFEESPVGASVWTNCYIDVHDSNGNTVSVPKGTIGKITKVLNDTVQIICDAGRCSVSKDNILINLPQVIPSAVYDIYNCYNSRYYVLVDNKVTVIPSVSGRNLYRGKKVPTKTKANGIKNEWIVPCLYKTAQKLSLAQQAALKQGDSLKIIDTYRSQNHTKSTYCLVNDSEYAKYIKPCVNTFLARSLSNHNKGIAVDCSLINLKTGQTYAMQTPYNLMSPDSYISNNNENADRLQKYMSDAGFTPLPSEWYHFTDNELLDTAVLSMNYPVSLYE